MTATTTTRTITIEELEAMPDDGYRYELIRGELIRMSPVAFDHGGVANEIAWHLTNNVRSTRGGRVMVEVGFILSHDPRHVVAPDVAFVSTERMPPRARRRHFVDGPPDLAVEVMSPSNSVHDINERVLDYLNAGTRLVWVVEPVLQTVTVWTPDRTARLLTADDVLDGGDVLPGFTVRVGDLFIDQD